LPPIRLTHFDAGDFRDGIPFVGRFERAGEEVLLLDWLWRKLGIDARAAEEQQFLHAGLMRAMDEIVLDLQILVKELRRVIVVGQNPSDLGGGHEDVARVFPFA
jgi:hypothetical protein